MYHIVVAMDILLIAILAMSHGIAGHDTPNDSNDKIQTITKLPGGPDTDSLTVSTICQTLGDKYCIKSQRVYIQAGRCLTQHNNSTHGIALGLCPYFPNKVLWLKASFSMYYSLPLNLTVIEQSNLTCGPYNREGLLCSKCKPRYGPAVYSFSLMCAECSDNGVGWALYLFVVLFPITVFYVIVIIFNIRATAPPFTAFVLMCQVYCTIELIHVPLRMRLEGMRSLSALTHIVRMLSGIWNLDFFRYLIPPFCVSSHFSNIEALSLEYIHIMYPFWLILVTFICIELHARNFRPIVLLWKPFHRVVTHLRRSWDPRASIVNAFSTFLLLILSKSIVITNNTFVSTNLPFMPTQKPLLYADPIIHMYSKEHLPYLLSAVVLTVVFFTLPTLLLCLYPTRVFRKLLSHCLSLRWQQAASAFIDTFQGHYKDGTNGTRDYRAASSIHLLVISLIIWICAGHNRRPLILEYVQPIFVPVSLFYALARPCKQEHANIIQSLLFALTALVLFIISSVKSYIHTFYLFLLMLLCMLTPHILLVGYIIYKIIRRAGHNYLLL